jgi:hypothetical protein
VRMHGNNVSCMAQPPPAPLATHVKVAVDRCCSCPDTAIQLPRPIHHCRVLAGKLWLPGRW